MLNKELVVDLQRFYDGELDAEQLRLALKNIYPPVDGEVDKKDIETMESFLLCTEVRHQLKEKFEDKFKLIENQIATRYGDSADGENDELQAKVNELLYEGLQEKFQEMKDSCVKRLEEERDMWKSTEENQFSFNCEKDMYEENVDESWITPEIKLMAYEMMQQA